MDELTKQINYIRKHYKKGKKTIDQIAKDLNIPRSTVAHRYRESIGKRRDFKKYENENIIDENVSEFDTKRVNKITLPKVTLDRELP